LKSGTYAALQRAAIDIVAIQLANGHGGILMGVHLDEGKATISLEARLNNIPKVLEKWDQIILSRVGRQIANVARRLPGWRLVDNHVITVDTVCWKMVMTIRSGGCHSHLLHGLLLGNGRLTLLVRPVAANRAGPEPLTIHGAEGLFGIGTVTECNETIATRTAGFHVPHDTSLRHGPKGGKSLRQNLIIHFVRKIANEDVEMVRGVLFTRGVGLIGPVHPNFLLPVRKNPTSNLG